MLDGLGFKVQSLWFKVRWFANTKHLHFAPQTLYLKLDLKNLNIELLIGVTHNLLPERACHF